MLVQPLLLALQPDELLHPVEALSVGRVGDIGRLQQRLIGCLAEVGGGKVARLIVRGSPRCGRDETVEHAAARGVVELREGDVLGV